MHSELVVKEIHEENLRRAEQARLVKLAQGARPRNRVWRIKGWIGALAAAFGLARPDSGPAYAVQSCTCAEC